jgi:hypothetical protein
VSFSASTKKVVVFLSKQISFLDSSCKLRSALTTVSLTLFLCLALFAPAPGQTPPRRNAGGRPVHNEAERAARWKDVVMPYRATELSAREQQMVAKLADACRLMDELYWHQSDLGGWAMFRVTQSPVLHKLFGIMGSRWDLADDNVPFLGEEPMPPGRELFPYGLSREQIDRYATARPETRDALYDSRTVVRGTPDQLQAVPYHEAYAEWLRPMAADLRAAARLSPDPAFAHYLQLRAEALLSDDYYASDIAWLDLKNPKIDLIFAPYETYLDGLLGVKTSYGGAILIRDQEQSRKLNLFQQNEAAMQQALPIPDADKPSKQGQPLPMEVVDAPLRAGDLRYGYQSVADNLPNDPRAHAEKGTKKIIFKNFMNARLKAVVLPIAARILASNQVKDVTADGYLTVAILHEISRGLGPAYAHIDGKRMDIREAIGGGFGALEEAKANATGVFLAKWLVDRKILPEDMLDKIYASYVGGIFCAMRVGTGEAQGRAGLMEFNYLLEQDALRQGEDGRYTTDYAAMPGAIAKLTEKLLTLEAQGDRAGAEAWFTKYDLMPDSLTRTLEAVKDTPVDIAPDFELAPNNRLSPSSPTALAPRHHDAARQSPGTIVVPASDFFATIPAGDNNDGRFPAGKWFFNNDTINMSAATEVTAKVPVRESGVYHLFVRSIGTATSSFRVKIDGKEDAGTYGRGALAWQRGGDFTLKPGTVEIRLTSIVPRPSLNVLVLTKNSGFNEDDLKALELPPEVKLLHEYHIEPSNIVKFGDVDGSGKFAVFDITSDYSAIMYANDGHELWRWQAPQKDARLRGEFEAPGILWDFHHTGRDEVAHWRMIDNKEWLVLCDGRTGEIIAKTPWPAPPMPHVYNNYRMAVAKFHKESDGPDTLLVLSDTGGLISLTAYDKDLNQLWQHSEHRDKDYFGHYIYPFDVNGDGVDEVIVSHFCLDANGSVIWNNDKYFEKNNDHMDAMEFFDINGDGKPELLTSQSDVGTLAYNAQTGAILWQNLSDHSQQITAGYILGNTSTPQVVTNGRTYVPMTRPPGAAPGLGTMRMAAPTGEIAVGGGLGAQLYWFDNRGRLLETWPAHPLNGNPNFVRGDWYGNGKRTYFWYRFKLEPDGNATLFFKGEVYHMFDFDHNGAEQVITLEGGTLRVYGNANVVRRFVKRDADYRRTIANHTHY